MAEPPTPANAFHAKHVRLLAQSYRKFVGRSLLEVSATPADSQAGEAFAKAIFEAPFVVLSHNTDPDPIFNYANLAAMKLFEMDWQTITTTPSRESAEPVNRAERDRLLTAVTAHNFIDDYSGVRISSSGRRFFIPKAIVWNVVNENGEYRGQAATFADWDFSVESRSVNTPQITS